MRAGIDVGPVWVSTDGCHHRHTRRARHGPPWTVIFAVFLLAGSGLVSVHILVWAIWALPVLCAVGAIERWARREAIRKPAPPPAPGARPRNERLHYSDRR